MNCMLHWSLSGHQHVCTSYSQEAITQATKENLKWKAFTTYSILVVQSPFKFWTDMKCFADFVCVCNPKVNRGCAPLTANHVSADCVQISLGPSIPYIPLGVYHTGGFNTVPKDHASWVFFPQRGLKRFWPEFQVTRVISLGPVSPPTYITQTTLSPCEFGIRREVQNIHWE